MIDTHSLAEAILADMIAEAPSAFVAQALEVNAERLIAHVKALLDNAVWDDRATEVFMITGFTIARN